MLALHLPAVLLQLAVRERVEGVGAGGAHDDVGLVLLLNNGLGGRHQLPLRTEEAGSAGALPGLLLPGQAAGRVGRGTEAALRVRLSCSLQGQKTEKHDVDAATE